MATFTELFTLRVSETLLGRFTIAVERAAAVIAREDTATPNHTARLEWAKRAIVVGANSQQYASTILKMSIAENSNLQTVGASVTDTDIQTLVNSYVPALVAVGA